MRRQLCIIGLFVLLAGCGRSEPFATAKVTGKITGTNGKPIAASRVRIWFIPQDVKPVGDKHPRPAEGELAPDGSILRLTTYRWNDGALLGRHKVVLEAYQANGMVAPGAIPARYRDAKTTPLVAEVRCEEPNRINLRLE